MSDMGTEATELEPLTQEEIKTIAPANYAPTLQASLIVFGVVLPLVLLWMSLAGSDPGPKHPWQSGELKDYIACLLVPRAWLIFFPGLVLSMISLTTWTLFPQSAKKVWIRLGIYSGVVLSSQYLILLLFEYGVSIIVAAFCVGVLFFVMLQLLSFCFQRWRRFQIWHMLVLTTVVALFIPVVLKYGWGVLFLPIFAIMASIFATPALNVVAYIYAATSVWHLASRDGWANTRGMTAASIAWVLAWIGAWRVAFLVMIDEYSKLPTVNPNCYLGNAAAFAHPILTGSKQRGSITKCVRRLKFLELFLLSVAPQIHRSVRTRYDKYCPPLARCCSKYQLLATLTCLMLKPIELIAEVVRFSVRIPWSKVEQLYSSQSNR